MSVVEKLMNTFKGVSFTLKEAYEAVPEKSSDSVRARIYENLGKAFQKLGRGVYITKEMDCILIEGDGRDLSMLEDESIDCIITDHPWDDKKANRGGSRNFASYDCFEYTAFDFAEKARVLKEGSFLCECVPDESATNFDYLYRLKKMAELHGFQYYVKIPWWKGTFVSNTGRKSKRSEDIIIFSKGKPRALRFDAQRSKKNGSDTFMSGTSGMLPAKFDVQAVSEKDRISQSEKPSLLFEQLLEFVTLENEVVLDQFAGSGAVAAACKAKNRKCILIEKSLSQVQKIVNRLSMNIIPIPQT